MADRTFVIIKPDAVERGLAGEILARFERKGLRIVAMEPAHDRRGDRRPALRGAPGQAVLRRADRLHRPLPVDHARARGPGGHVEGRAHAHGRHQPAGVGAGHHPGRLRHPAHREPRARQRRPGVGRPGRSASSSRSWPDQARPRRRGVPPDRPLASLSASLRPPARPNGEPHACEQPADAGPRHGRRPRHRQHPRLRARPRHRARTSRRSSPSTSATGGPSPSGSRPSG